MGKGRARGMWDKKGGAGLSLQLETQEREGSALERAFETRLMQARMQGVGLPEWVREFKFLPDRKFRADFAWPEHKLLVEIEGGIHSGGRHVRGKGYTDDVKKYNLAVIAGFRVLRFTGQMITDDPQACIYQIMGLLS